MRQVLILALFVVVCFMIESVLNVAFSPWFQPDILIILLVFFNLFRGTRYGVIVAVLAGIMRDSFGVNFFGLNIFSLLACAFLSTLIKTYIYQAGSGAYRILVVFLLTLANILIQYLWMLTVKPMPFSEMFGAVLLPTLLSTIIVTPFVFDRVRKCALKLFA